MLVAEGVIDALANQTGRLDQVVDAGGFVALRPKDLHGFIEYVLALKSTRPRHTCQLLSPLR